MRKKRNVRKVENAAVSRVVEMDLSIRCRANRMVSRANRMVLITRQQRCVLEKAYYFVERRLVRRG